jgi:hypothetical protein
MSLLPLWLVAPRIPFWIVSHEYQLATIVDLAFQDWVLHFYSYPQKLDVAVGDLPILPMK